MSQKIDIDKKVGEIKDPTTETRKWDTAKRDKLTFRSRKMKARQFIRIVENSLPKLTKIDTGEPTDHRENIKKAYCEAGLNGIKQYEELIWGIFKASSFTQEMSKLSVRSKNVLAKCFDVSSIAEIYLSDLYKKSITEILGTKGAGAKTKAEIEEFYLKFLS